jgi:tetraacyldisaccharide 4'-kinase
MNFKKPKFWDYKKPSFISYLLLPISFLLRLLNSLKSKLTSATKFSEIKTICVGNIYLGGTGKTSLTLKINDILKDKNIKSCFIKKHYEDQIDEQKILENSGKLFKATKREIAIKHAINEGYEVAILDDGLQDFSINYDLCIVCFNNINWIGNGLTIPSGPLRENINNLKKYKHIFLNGNLENLENIKRDILKINSEINIYIGKYIPENIKEFNIKDRYLAFSGIGNHRTFISMLKSYDLNIVKDIEFPDHYKYSKNDIEKIILDSKNQGYKIITTEKDFLRLQPKNYNEINFIKSKLEIQNESEFLQSLTKII